jgi:uncharacterized protein (DUF2147 family)
MNIRNFHALSALVLMTAMAFTATTAAAEEEKMPSGTVSIESTGIAVGVGVTWGDGVLTYKGEEHKFKIDGLTLVDLGFSKVEAKGEVYDLNKLEDFNGSFVAATAAYAIGKKGEGDLWLRNDNGVKLHLTSTQKGARLSLAGQALGVTLAGTKPEKEAMPAE